MSQNLQENKMKRIFLLISILLFISVSPMTSLSYGETASVSTSQIKVLFSPLDNCAKEIVSEIDKAENYVYVAMYFFTSRPLAQSLIRARDRGVDVKVCLDKDQPHYEYSKNTFLENKGIGIKLIGSSGIMHNKFCVIDGYITITGSYNWTVRADLENDEDVLIIKSEEIAKIYKEQFNKYWNGTYIDTCAYKDEDRLEKVPVDTGAGVPIVKPSRKGKYIGHKESKKFHYPDCKWGMKIKPENQVWFDSREEAIEKGYIPCKVCKP